MTKNKYVSARISPAETVEMLSRIADLTDAGDLVMHAVVDAHDVAVDRLVGRHLEPHLPDDNGWASLTDVKTACDALPYAAAHELMHVFRRLMGQGLIHDAQTVDFYARCLIRDRARRRAYEASSAGKMVDPTLMACIAKVVPL